MKFDTVKCAECNSIYVELSDGFELLHVDTVSVYFIALLIFPNEWHSYRPDESTGWSEYWIGFRGYEAERIMTAFFSPSSPIRSIKQLDALNQLFEQLMHWMQQPVAGSEQILASHIPMALALLNSGANFNPSAPLTDAELVAQAKVEMLKNLSAHTDLEAIAQRLGVSYSRFRFAFKKQTDYAPRAYENSMKLNRAKDLLRHEENSVSRVASELGYTSLYYFSRAFKKQFGISPKQWQQAKTIIRLENSKESAATGTTTSF